MISAEFLILDDTTSSDIKDMFSFETKPSSEHRIVDIDDLTNGVSLAREGFSIGLPKIIKGDDSGKDYQRSNKFVEEDSRDFTEKYFSSKQCSIGSGIGAITMFGDNELIGDSRTAKIHSVYDFSGNWTANDTTGNTSQRFIYFKDCVYDPITRNDFRAFKKEIYSNINAKIIDIPNCLKRFNVDILFSTKSDITADVSRQGALLDDEITNKNNNDKFSYVSIIKGSTNTVKLDNIQPLDKGNNSDNASDKKCIKYWNKICIKYA
jgi:hypothetical protein